MKLQDVLNEIRSIRESASGGDAKQMDQRLGQLEQKLQQAAQQEQSGSAQQGGQDQSQPKQK